MILPPSKPQKRTGPQTQSIGCQSFPVVYKMKPAMPTAPRILYCNCTYAQVVSKEVKEAVLRHLCESGVPFEAVADLCEMSARKDPALQRFSQCGDLKVAACFPRAVKWLFASAKA